MDQRVKSLYKAFASAGLIMIILIIRISILECYKIVFWVTLKHNAHKLIWNYIMITFKISRYFVLNCVWKHFLFQQILSFIWLIMKVTPNLVLRYRHKIKIVVKLGLFFFIFTLPKHFNAYSECTPSNSGQLNFVQVG
jgi:hypothetical protein